MNEERDERLFAKMEQQVSRAEIQLKGLSDRDRQWFQTMKQRRDEHERLTNNFKAAEAAAKDPNGGKPDRLSKLSDSKRKKLAAAERKKTPSQLAKEKYKKGIERGSLLRAKAVKTQKKPQKLRSIEENDDGNKRAMRKPKSSKFAQDLTDTSRRGAKRLR